MNRKSRSLIALFAAMNVGQGANAQNENGVLDEKLTSNTLEEIVVTGIGSRSKPRSATDAAVPVDVFSNENLKRTNQIDIGQSLHYSAPSFNAVKFGINDLSPLVDPASLRGLGADQTLLLVNGKRRHKVSFFSLNHGVGKGQLGNDINAIPSAAIKSVEILRDGAAAQYGSDAIAGVVNMSLNDASSGGSVRVYGGVSHTKPEFDGISSGGVKGESIGSHSGTTSDGDAFKVSANFGLKWGEDGFINTTLWRHHNDAYDRSGSYTHSAGWYPDDPALTDAENQAEDARLRAENGIDLDRAILGGAENTNYGIFMNAGRPINENWNLYTFGGYSEKEVIGGIFSRAAARSDRSALDIFPNGFNPVTPADMKDWQLVVGATGELANDWTLDMSAGYSGNDLDLFNTNTVNPSLGSASPTEFFTGALAVTQTLLNVDASKTLGDGNTNLAVGAEFRYETFKQTPGQLESWVAGPLAGAGGKDVGSTGREGFSDITAASESRDNIGIYAEIERDFSDNFLVAGALRWENYSDFGSDVSFKLASRYRFSDAFALRGSINKSFRAPALAQTHYSNYVQIAFDDAGNSVVTPFLPVSDPRVGSAFGISELKPETSQDFAIGFTAEPTDNFTLTVDLYQINLEDRIIVSGGITAADFPTFDGAGFDEINIFTNAVDTKTKGLDIVANYNMDFDSGNALALSFAANFNDTTVDGFNIPAAFGDSDIIDDRDIVFITDGVPSEKLIFSAAYTAGKFDLLARATRFGEVQDSRETDPATGEAQVFSDKTVWDLSSTFHVNDQLDMSLGVNNVFDEYPDMLISPNIRGEVLYSRRTNQFGTLGRFINFSINYNW